MHLPGPLRAAVGLVASAAEEAKHLPDRAIELPMLAVSTALQVSLRAQQRYARLAARGDAILNRRAPTADPPPWATFDDPVSMDELRRTAFADLDGGGDTSALIADILGVSDPADGAPVNGNAAAAPSPAKQAAAKKAPVKTAGAKKATNGKTVSKPRHTAPSAFDNACEDAAAEDASADDPSDDD